MSNNDVENVIFRLPPDVKRDFQVYCITSGQSMQEILSKYVSNLLKGNQSKQRRRSA
jgi:hypothetical protein